MGRHRRPGRYRSSVYAAVGAAVTGTVTVTSTMAAAAAVHPAPRPRGNDPDTETLTLGYASNSAERMQQIEARQAAQALRERQAAAAAAAAARAKALAAEQAKMRQALAAAAQARKQHQMAAAARYSARASSMAARILALAASQAGKPYEWGASGPNAYDCSGFTMWVFSHLGISLPHNSGAQYDTVKHIPASEAQPGDLVFVFDGPGGAVSHVAIYAGDGYWWEAPHPGATVGKDKAWSTNIAYGRAY